MKLGHSDVASGDDSVDSLPPGGTSRKALRRLWDVIRGDRSARNARYRSTRRILERSAKAGLHAAWLILIAKPVGCALAVSGGRWRASQSRKSVDLCRDRCGACK